MNIEAIYNLISKENLKELFCNFRLDFYGVHGFPHWCRVIENGYILSQSYNIDMDIIICFALFHDIERVCDEYDYQHGLRGGNFFLNNLHLINNINEQKAQIIYEACSGHTDIHHSDNLNIAACWDSDRLDLMRVGIFPQSPYLNLEKSKKSNFIQTRSDIAWNNSLPKWANELL